MFEFGSRHKNKQNGKWLIMIKKTIRVCLDEGMF